MKCKWGIMIVIVLGLIFSLSFAAFAQLPGGISREETLIADQLTGRVGMPDNFNLWAGWRNQDRGLQQLLLEPLWTVDYATGEIISGSAADFPVYSDDLLQMTIHLREDVYWNDGVPFTADDVAFTIELHVDTPGLLYHGPMAEFVESVTVVDEHTVTVNLTRPSSRFHAHFLDRWGCLRIMPKHIFEDVEDVMAFKYNPPVGTGAYKLLDYDPAGFWTLWERREDWDRSPTGILYGKPQPQYVLFQWFESEEGKILAQLRNELDMAQHTEEGLRVILDRSDTARAWRRDWPWVVNIDPCITGIMLNNMVEPYDNKDVRWALTLAIDIVDYAAIATDLMAPVSPLHLPPVPAYLEHFFLPMEDWLKEFEIDIGNGETFNPYDPDVPQRILAEAEERGYPVPDDPDIILEQFGMGWWKYAPDVAAQLLENNGFSRNAEGNWLLPDGSPWKIDIVTDPAVAHHHMKNALAAAEQWRNFGIDATVYATEAYNDLTLKGEYSVSTQWPAAEPWGAGVDLIRTFDVWHSRVLTPIGETVAIAPGGAARWSDPRMDELIEAMEVTDPIAEEEKTIELGIEALKLVIKEMPTIPVYGYTGPVAWDEAYWTNWPGAENPYSQPYQHWPNLKYMLPFLEKAE